MRPRLSPLKLRDYLLLNKYKYKCAYVLKYLVTYKLSTPKSNSLGVEHRKYSSTNYEPPKATNIANTHLSEHLRSINNVHA